jgi:hypothetical protein
MPPAWADASLSVGRSTGLEAKGAISIRIEASSASGLRWAEVDVFGSHTVAPDLAKISYRPNPDDPNSQYACCSYATTSNPLQQDIPWDTRTDTPYNGTYTFRLKAAEQFRSDPVCSTSASSRFDCIDITVKVNNPPEAPQWDAVPAVTEGSPPNVRMSWSYGGDEPDMREFQVVRDGKVIAYVAAPGPGTYDFNDGNFPDTGYAGSYSYKIMALRSSVVGPNKCGTAGGGYSAGSPCIGTYTSSSHSVSLVEPKQTTGGGGGSFGGGSTPGSTGSTSGSSVGFRPAPGSRTIVGGRNIRRLPGEDDGFFTSGTYKATLPYDTNKFVFVPNGTAGGDDTNRIEAIEPGSTGASPIGDPIHDRTLLLPFAGGLLLFLGAAHTRRLLRDR